MSTEYDHISPEDLSTMLARPGARGRT